MNQLLFRRLLKPTNFCDILTPCLSTDNASLAIKNKSEQIRQLPVDLYGGGSPFPVERNYFFWKKSSEIIYFFLYCSEIIFLWSHDLYFLDDSLFKCKSITVFTPLLNWFSMILTYAAQLFFLLILERKYFFWWKSERKYFFLKKGDPPHKDQLVAA